MAKIGNQLGQIPVGQCLAVERCHLAFRPPMQRLWIANEPPQRLGAQVFGRVVRDVEVRPGGRIAPAIERMTGYAMSLEYREAGTDRVVRGDADGRRDHRKAPDGWRDGLNAHDLIRPLLARER